MKKYEKTEFDYVMDDFFTTNYPMLLATFLEENHDKFMEHCTEKYEDHEGQDMKWIWKESSQIKLNQEKVEK